MRSPFPLSGTSLEVDGRLRSEDSLTWPLGSTISGDGDELDDHLPRDTHQVTLSAVDSPGRTGAASTTVVVGDRVYLPVIVTGS